MAEFIYTMTKARKAHGDKVILDDVTMSFYPGAKIGVVGPNGAGKSTILKIMAGLDQPSNGEARLSPGYSVGILMQEPTLNEDKTVLGNVEEGAGEIKAVLDRYNEIAAYVATHSRGMIAKDRVINFGDRFDLAGAIAKRMMQRANASLTDSLVLPSQVLVANGADPNKFFDPLALSPIAAYRGTPILLVSVGKVPAATSMAIARLRAANANTRVYVGGGSGTVSESVRGRLRATRIWGPDRYSNATAIANYAFARGWLLDTAPAAVASTITNAQIAGAMMGGHGGALVLTRSTSLPSVTSSWLMAHMNTLPMVCVFGSTADLSESVRNSVIQAVN